MKTATGILRREHEAILETLEVVEALAGALARAERVAASDLAQALEFLVTFADRCHHGKEEGILFRALERKGIPRHGGPLAVMLYEHDIGRSLLRDMTDSQDGYGRGVVGAGPRWGRAAIEYCTLLRRHVYKENNVLFAIAERALSENEQEELAEACDLLEREMLGDGTRERLYQQMTELRARMIRASMAGER
jgi:hemerythrin-like domain-containing protein